MTRRVLVVDDSATLRKIATSVLREAGYEVDTASDGAEGLERVQRAPCDLMLVDFVMPRLNGYQLTQAIRSIPSLRDLPVVLMSARAEQIGARFMAQTGAVGALPKPFTPDALLALVADTLRDGPRPTDLPPPVERPATIPPPVDTEVLSRTASERAPEDLSEPIAQYFDTGPPPIGDGRDQFFAERLMALGMESRLDTDIAAAPLLLAGTPSVAPPVPTSVEAAAGFRRALARALMPMIRDLSSTRGTIDEDAILRALDLYLPEPALRQMSSSLESMHRALRPDAALEGSLSQVPLGEVFQLLHLQAQTGVLVVSRAGAVGDAEVTFAVQQGRIDQGFGRAVGGEYLLGRYLVADELIDPMDLLSAVSMARASATLLGEFLVTRGALGPASLEQCLLRQTSELVYEVLRWPQGRFRFESGGSVGMQVANLGIPSETLVLEGFRRIDEWRLISEYLPSERVVFAHERGAVDAMAAERLDRDERRVLDAVDGRRNVREVIDAVAMNAFEGCKILYRLVRARLLVPVSL